MHPLSTPNKKNIYIYTHTLDFYFEHPHLRDLDWALQGVSEVGTPGRLGGWALQGDQVQQRKTIEKKPAARQTRCLPSLRATCFVEGTSMD